jgi:hypothetical protein
MMHAQASHENDELQNPAYSSVRPPPPRPFPPQEVSSDVNLAKTTIDMLEMYATPVLYCNGEKMQDEIKKAKARCERILPMPAAWQVSQSHKQRTFPLPRRSFIVN